MRSPPPPSILQLEKQKLKDLKRRKRNKKSSSKSKEIDADGLDSTEIPTDESTIIEVKDNNVVQKRKRKKEKKKTEEIIDEDSLPLPPASPFPYCHPGILYQVCPQYAGKARIITL